jgi:hypothetical protein
MKKFFRRPRRETPEVSANAQHQSKQCAAPEATSYVSSRTGGFEVPRDSDHYVATDDDTLMDSSIYTDPFKMSVGVDVHHKDVCSTASTVQLSSRRPSPLYTDDIQMSLDKYKGALQTPKVIQVRVQSTPPTQPSTPHSASKTSADRTRQTPSPPSPDAWNSTSVHTPNTLQHNTKIRRSTGSARTNVSEQTPIRSNQSLRHLSVAVDWAGDGFELNNTTASQHENNDDASSLQMSKIHISDTELMEDASDTGGLRLTAEGLKSHERIALQQAVVEKPMHQFELWRREKQNQKWLREKHKERQAKLADQNIRMRQQSLHTMNDEQSTIKRKRSKVGSRPKEDLTDFSLAPLNAMEHLSLKIPAEAATSSSMKPKTALPFFGLFRKKKDLSATAQNILQRERQAAIAAQHQRKLWEQREKERIDRKRRVHLEEQRAREADVARPGFFQASLKDGKPATTEPASYISSLTLVNSPPRLRNESVSPAMSTLSSTTTSKSTLPPCVVCQSSERTHIAMPCMHFSFCRSCASGVLQLKPNACPVCFAPNVTFAAVSV